MMHPEIGQSPSDARALAQATLIRKIFPLSVIAFFLQFFTSMYKIVSFVQNPQSIGVDGNALVWGGRAFIMDQVFQFIWFAFLAITLYTLPILIYALFQLRNHIDKM